MTHGRSPDELFQDATALARAGRHQAAEAALLGVLTAQPAHAGAMAGLGQLALQRGAAADALRWFSAARRASPDDPQHGLDEAFAHLGQERLDLAGSVLRETLARHPDCFTGWLMLGQVAEAMDDAAGALRAFHQAVWRAQRAGCWRDEGSTPPDMLEAVVHAIEQVRRGRRSLYYGSYDAVRERVGAAALKRVDRALAGYLKETQEQPDSPHQRPRFFFFPGLPAGPYHDPMLQPWAPALQQAFPAIRDEALQTLAEDSHFENFVRFRDGVRPEDYLRGNGAPPAWEAFFFYRHGQRYDAHHARCPKTSAALESIELCRIADEAPEICFSVLTPGSEILPHHGVSNVRLVMHLPLQVPARCALNVMGGGEHHWREGELVLFDDTYRHEAWNRSDDTRIVLLMDCWNPHLEAHEREAVKLLLETISGLGRSDAPRQH